jgi:CRP/FNR family transcriptional regulator, cyclic AMP receptor protein
LFEKTRGAKDRASMVKETGKGVGATAFGQLPQEKWDELGRAVEDLVATPGTVIFRQGDPGDKFYLIRTGSVRVFRQDAGRETELSVLQAGGYFGEMALFMDEPRSATVAALEETHLLVLSKEQFQDILKEYPNVTFAFVRQMCERLLRDSETKRRKG